MFKCYGFGGFELFNGIALPIKVAARSEASKAWTDFARSNPGIVGSNPTQGINICVRLFCVYR
jgi:hypothetical protein